MYNHTESCNVMQLNLTGPMNSHSEVARFFGDNIVKTHFMRTSYCPGSIVLFDFSGLHSVLRIKQKHGSRVLTNKIRLLHLFKKLPMSSTSPGLMLIFLVNE